MFNKLSGKEELTFRNQKTGLSILEYWQWLYSDIYDLQDTLAEYIVAKALGKEEPNNTGSWTLYDIAYRGKRIEIKETSYYHSGQTDDESKSKVRKFGIAKAYSKYQDNTSDLERQNDLYVFCLNTGETRTDSNPLQLEHWEFYIVPTSVINEKCGDQKTISLSRIREMTEKVDYDQLKDRVDEVIDQTVDLRNKKQG